MATFLPQAQFRAPQNALLNLQPLNDALDSNRRNALLQGQQEMQREELGMRRDEHQMRQRQFDQNQQTATIQRLGRRAQAIAALPENDPRRAQAWQAVLREHPGAGSLDQSWLDPVTGPQMLVAEAGEWMDPMKRRLLEAQTAQAEAGVANIPLQQELTRAQIEQARRKDARAEMEAGLLAEIFPGLRQNQGQPLAAGAPAQSGPQLAPQMVPQVGPGGATMQPMSAPVDPTADPMLIQTQAADVAPESPQPSVVDRLTPAQRQALGLGLIGKGDAGKILLDADSANRLGKEATNAVEKRLTDTFNQLGRLTEIQEQFKPEYLMWDKRAGFAWDRLMDSTSMTRKSITPQQTQELAEFSAFKQEAVENLNRYIKEITGAQMSEAEAARLMRAMPNPGVGIFDGDSPTEFKAKLDNAVRTAQLAYARDAYLRKNGFAGPAEEAARRVPLQRMQGIIQQRTNGILQEVQRANPGVPPAQLAPLVRQRLRAEFGISA